MAPLDEDLDEYLDPDDGPGSTATIGANSINGIFDAANEDVLGVDGVAPTFLVKESDVLSGVAAVGVTIDAISDPNASGSYVIRESQPDGTGMSLLVLESQ